MRAPADVLAELRNRLAANRDLYAEPPMAGLDATDKPELAARLDALLANNPGLEDPPMREPEPTTDEAARHLRVPAPTPDRLAKEGEEER